MCTESIKTRTDLSLNEINILLDEEKDIKTYKKLQYFKFKIMGFTKIESCNLAGIKESSRYYLEDLWETGGYNALIPHYGGGRKSKLKDYQFEDLQETLKTKDSWLISEVEKLIKNKYGVKYGYHGVRKLLIKLNIPIANHFETMDKNKKNVLDNINNLPSENIEEIEKITNKITNEKSQFVLKKLSYLLLRYLGYSNKQASKMYGISTVTGNNWFKTWQNEGYEALKRKPGQGRKKKLNDENLLDLKKTRKKR